MTENELTEVAMDILKQVGYFSIPREDAKIPLL